MLEHSGYLDLFHLLFLFIKFTRVAWVFRVILIVYKATLSSICKVGECQVYLISKYGFKYFRQLNLPNCIIGDNEEITCYAPGVETADSIFFNAFKCTFYIVKGE